MTGIGLRHKLIVIATLSLFAGTGWTSPLLRLSIPQNNRQIDGQGKTITALTWEGAQFTHPEVIDRELLNRAGSKFDTNFARVEFNRFRSLDIFADVQLTTRTGVDTVAVVWQFKEMPTLLMLPDIASEPDGGIAAGGLIAGTNFLGRNIRIAVEALWGKTRNYQYEFEHPWFGNNRHALRIMGGYHEQQNEAEHFFEKYWDSDIWLEQWTTRSNHFDLGGGFLLLEGDDSTKTLRVSGKDRNGWFGVRGSIDRRNDISHPSAGQLLQLEGKQYFGDSHYTEFTFDGRSWFPFTDRLYWAQSVLCQLRTNVNDFPVYQTYRLGGSQTIRGNSLKDLGKWQFGKNEVIATSELRWRFLPRVVAESMGFAYPFGVEAALFGDAGTAWDATTISQRRISVGGGAGLRFLVPAIKEVRIDYARGEGGNSAFSLTIGVKEKYQRYRIR